MLTQLTLPYDAPQVGEIWRYTPVPGTFMVCVCPQTGKWLYLFGKGGWAWAAWSNPKRPRWERADDLALEDLP